MTESGVSDAALDCQTAPQIFSQAVKGYFASKERDNIRLMEYAKKFHIDEKVQEYMEIL